jgi:NAD(P)-dependent dehydrogenase (short-subunit alcohol dehydrogenase family)
MTPLQGGIAVITGAASGFGLEASRIAARLGMKIVMADVQADALATSQAEIESLGAARVAVPAGRFKGRRGGGPGRRHAARFGTPNFVFNNAGVGAGGLIWEHTPGLGMGHRRQPHGRGARRARVHTADAGGGRKRPELARPHRQHRQHGRLLNAPNMGVYNVSKHAVVSLSETLYQDLALVSEQVHAHVLCPFFVPTGIHQSERNQPADVAAAARPTRSQMIARRP